MLKLTGERGPIYLQQYPQPSSVVVNVHGKTVVRIREHGGGLGSFNGDTTMYYVVNETPEEVLELFEIKDVKSVPLKPESEVFSPVRCSIPSCEDGPCKIVGAEKYFKSLPR